MPDRLPSLLILVTFWIPPVIAGRLAAELVHKSVTRVRPALIVSGLAGAVIVWTGIWFLVNLGAMPPYIPGATPDPTYPAPPQAVAALAVFSGALVLPLSAVACALAFRWRTRSLKRA
jgi:hypothetical protein